MFNIDKTPFTKKFQYRMRTQKDRGKQGPLKKSVKQKVLESTLKTIKREILQKIAEFTINFYKSIYKL